MLILRALWKALQVMMRNTARNDLCDGLVALGLNARISERGREEEKIDGSAFGVIDVGDSPICWVNLRRKVHLPSFSVGLFPQYEDYIDYGIPSDVAIDIRANLIMVRTTPIFGKKYDVRWEIDAFSLPDELGITSRLNGDPTLRAPLLDSEVVMIRSHSRYNCWVITAKNKTPPSKELWECYESTARHLLANTGGIEEIS